MGGVRDRLGQGVAHRRGVDLEGLSRERLAGCNLPGRGVPSAVAVGEGCRRRGIVDATLDRDCLATAAEQGLGDGHAEERRAVDDGDRVLDGGLVLAVDVVGQDRLDVVPVRRLEGRRLAHILAALAEPHTGENLVLVRQVHVVERGRRDAGLQAITGGDVRDPGAVRGTAGSRLRTSRQVLETELLVEVGTRGTRQELLLTGSRQAEQHVGRGQAVHRVECSSGGGAGTGERDARVARPVGHDVCSRHRSAVSREVDRLARDTVAGSRDQLGAPGGGTAGQWLGAGLVVQSVRAVVVTGLVEHATGLVAGATRVDRGRYVLLPLREGLQVVPVVHQVVHGDSE